MLPYTQNLAGLKLGHGGLEASFVVPIQVNELLHDSVRGHMGSKT